MKNSKMMILLNFSVVRKRLINVEINMLVILWREHIVNKAERIAEEFEFYFHVRSLSVLD